MDSEEAESKLNQKILLGPGPSNVPCRILNALSQSCMSHLDPDFFKTLDEIRENLKILFKTNNENTFAISGTGSAGMEASFANLIENKDRVIIFVSGLFGERMADVAGRYNAEVVVVKKDWGESFTFEEMKEVIDNEENIKIVSIVHAETSTGAKQDIKQLGEFLKLSNIIFVVDSVTSFTGLDLDVDSWGIDVCYSGSQKCLNVPPGLSPITFSDKAMAKIKNRKYKVKSWYLDLNLLQNYHSKNRIYHHTAPVNMLFALNEGLKICLEEGLETRINRHQEVSVYFSSKLANSPFEYFVKNKKNILPMLKTIKLPNHISDNKRTLLLKDESLEIGGGLGDTKGKVWRVGLMGCNATNENVDIFFNTLEKYI